MSFINNMEEETENNKEKKLFKWETISLIVAYIVKMQYYSYKAFNRFCK